MIPSLASSLARILNPRSITVVGASASRPDATGNQVIRNLRHAGFDGRIEVMNPSGGVIEGIEAVTHPGALEATDTAVIAVRPDSVLSVLQGLEAVGVPSAVLLSVGMDGSQAGAVAAFARRTGMRVHGPNCMGVITTRARVCMWADEDILVDVPVGNVGLISQSGSAAIFVARSTSGIGFSSIISTGNEAAVTTADYIDALVEDEDTDVIGLVLESLHDADGFRAAVERARAAGKPVVAMRVGSSAAGATAARAHTGALLGNDAVTTALFERVGVPLVADYDELASTLDLLARLDGRPVAQGRTAVVTISGGQAALSADLAESVGVPLAQPSDATRALLADRLPGVAINNPLDAGAGAYADDDAWGDSIAALAADPGVDVVLAVIDAQSTLTDAEIEYEDDMVAELANVRSSVPIPVLAASSSSLTLHPRRWPTMRSDATVLRGIRNAFVAIKAAVEATADVAPAPARPVGLPSPERVANLRARLASAEAGVLDADAARDLLDAYGIRSAAALVADRCDDAVAFAAAHGYPVAMKIASRDIAHRSDIGAVVLDIADEAGVQEAWHEIHRNVAAERPDARIDGVEIQRQYGRAVEAFIGVSSDPAVGAVVAAGMGGVLVELLGDAARALAPFDAAAAQRLVASTRLHALLGGYRNLHDPIDPADLARTLERVSWLASDMQGVLGECDLNPVLFDASTGDVVVVDVLVTASSRSGVTAGVRDA